VGDAQKKGPASCAGLLLIHRRVNVERRLDRHAYQVDGSRAFPAAA
jgi:hypothetical protein